MDPWTLGLHPWGLRTLGSVGAPPTLGTPWVLGPRAHEPKDPRIQRLKGPKGLRPSPRDRELKDYNLDRWAPGLADPEGITFKCPSVQVSKCPSVQVSKCPSVQVCKCPSVQVSKCPSVQVSKYPYANIKMLNQCSTYKCPSVQVSKCPRAQVSKCTSVQVSKCPSVQVSKCTSVQVSRGTLGPQVPGAKGAKGGNGPRDQRAKMLQGSKDPRN